MKKLKINTRAYGLVLVILSLVLCSFAINTGSDSYEIYLNAKLVLKEYVHGRKEVKSITLNRNSGEDAISVNYSHCGQMGTSRKISVNNRENKILKEWHFADTQASKDPMVFKVEEIISLASQHSGLTLTYSSNELPDGLVLATIQVPNVTASKK